MTDAHYSSYAELLEKVEWDKYGVVDGVARDPRCENCMVHCGYEPTASLGLAGASAATRGRQLNSILGRNRNRPAAAAKFSPSTASAAATAI